MSTSLHDLPFKWAISILIFFPLRLFFPSLARPVFFILFFFYLLVFLFIFSRIIKIVGFPTIVEELCRPYPWTVNAVYQDQSVLPTVQRKLFRNFMEMQSEVWCEGAKSLCLCGGCGGTPPKKMEIESENGRNLGISHGISSP